MGVRQRLEHLREGYARGLAGHMFGANGHQFEILPRLREADLAEAEAQLGVQFPEEYRGFLTAVSAGGAGPYYGLFPLGRDAAGCWGWRGDGADLTDRSALGTNFEPGDIGANLAGLEATRPPSDDEEAYEDWLNRYAMLVPQLAERGRGDRLQDETRGMKSTRLRLALGAAANPYRTLWHNSVFRSMNDVVRSRVLEESALLTASRAEFLAPLD